MTIIRHASIVAAWLLTALLPAASVGLWMLPSDSQAAPAPRATTARPPSTRASATTRRPNSRASRYVAQITPRASSANARVRERRQAGGASATAPAAGNRNGVRFGAPPFASWSAWNRASAAPAAQPPRATRSRASASGRTVRFRVQTPRRR